MFIQLLIKLFKFATNLWWNSMYSIILYNAVINNIFQIRYTTALWKMLYEKYQLFSFGNHFDWDMLINFYTFFVDNDYRRNRVYKILFKVFSLCRYISLLKCYLSNFPTIFIITKDWEFIQLYMFIVKNQLGW